MVTSFPVAARETVCALTERADDGSTIRAVVGFDGFVDEIVSVVQRRLAPDQYEPFASIADFARAVAAAAGLSTNFEVVSKQVKVGGNAPIMALGLAKAGLDVTCIGALGEETLHPAFQELAEQARLITVADPGSTQALEFSDGKLMLGKSETMNAVTWERLLERTGEAQLQQLCGDADVLAFVNWTMLPHMDDIWRQFQTQILPRFEHRPIAFFDLADPHKRTTAELRTALNIIAGFTPYCDTYLGLNRKEAAEVGAALGFDETTRIGADLETAVRTLAKAVDVTGLVVHPVDRAAAYYDGAYVEVDGPYTPAPRLTTGAGDNFNAGFCHGVALGLPVEAALTLGNATSGFYVREGHSPTFGELVQFMTTQRA